MKRGRGLARVAVLSAFACATAFGATFELEPKNSTDPPGFIRDDVGPPDALDDAVDWTALFDVPADELDTNYTNDSDAERPEPKSSLPAGILRAGFFRDFTINSTADATAYTTGTKDIQNISGGGAASGSWQCKRVNNISDKGDVLNAYAAIYQHDNGDIVLAMGSERATDTGTSKVGFWFLQDPDADCLATGGGAFDWTGDHIDGDLLVVINFSQGGNNPTPIIYRWTGNAATGGLVQVNTTGGECTIGTSEDCATTNQTQTLVHSEGDIPWLTQVKQSGQGFGHDLGPLRFFEAQVNLTDHNLLKCFNRFVANTRQSDSTSSTVFDYVIGDFNVCGFTASKSCTSSSVSNGTDVNYNFKVNVVNAGIAALQHVKVTEAANNGCSVTSSNDETIAAGANKDFTVSCSDVGLGFINQAQVDAKDGDGNDLVPITVTADVDDFPTACAVNVTSDITMTSVCDKVILEDTGSRLGLEATMKMTVHAPSSANSEALDNVKIDVYDKDCTGELTSCTKITTIDVASQLKNGDADVVKTHTYDVELGDNTSSSSCAASAIFQRRVIAFGTGNLSGNTYHSSLLNGTPVALPVDCKPCIDCVDPPPEE